MILHKEAYYFILRDHEVKRVGIIALEAREETPCFVMWVNQPFKHSGIKLKSTTYTELLNQEI